MVVELKKGLRIPENVGPYPNANVIHVSKNGWCECQWDDGRKFKARAHWLVQKTEYIIVPTIE